MNISINLRRGSTRIMGGTIVMGNKPTFTSGVPMRAWSAITARSQAQIMPAPAPIATPLTRAIVGFRQACIVSNNLPAK